MKKFDPISTALVTMTIGFFFSLVACESKPRKAQIETLRANQVTQKTDYSNKKFKDLDFNFKQDVEKQWNEVLGAKIGFVDVANELKGIELIRQASQYKVFITTKTDGLCYFENFKDSNETSKKWIRGNGKNKSCQKLQVQSVKDQNRYFLSMKGFAGFGIPVKATIVEQEYSVKDIYGYNIDSDIYQNPNGEAFASHFLHRGPIQLRLVKVYLPTEVTQKSIYGFTVIHPFFSIFSHDKVKQMEEKTIDWSVPVSINSRGMASSIKNKVTAKRIQFHYYNQNPMITFENKSKLWIKIQTDNDFSLSVNYDTK